MRSSGRLWFGGMAIIGTVVVGYLSPRRRRVEDVALSDDQVPGTAGAR